MKADQTFHTLRLQPQVAHPRRPTVTQKRASFPRPRPSEVTLQTAGLPLGLSLLEHGAPRFAVLAGSTVSVPSIHRSARDDLSSNSVPGVGVFQEYYENQLLRGYSSSTISWIPSLQIFFIMGLVSSALTFLLFGTVEADPPHLLQGPFVGVIFDRYGPRHLLLVGSLLHVLGIMMTSLGSEYYQILLAQGVCSSIGAACIFQPCKAPSISLDSPLLSETNMLGY